MQRGIVVREDSAVGRLRAGIEAVGRHHQIAQGIDVALALHDNQLVLLQCQQSARVDRQDLACRVDELHEGGHLRVRLALLMLMFLTEGAIFVIAAVCVRQLLGSGGRIGHKKRGSPFVPGSLCPAAHAPHNDQRLRLVRGDLPSLHDAHGPRRLRRQHQLLPLLQQGRIFAALASDQSDGNQEQARGDLPHDPIGKYSAHTVTDSWGTCSLRLFGC